MRYCYVVEWKNSNPRYSYMPERQSQVFTSKKKALEWAKMYHNKQPVWFGTFKEFTVVKITSVVRTVVEKVKLD